VPMTTTACSGVMYVHAHICTVQVEGGGDGLELVAGWGVDHSLERPVGPQLWVLAHLGGERRDRILTRRARISLGTATQCTRRNDSPRGA
jgi:hypothetical protein